MPSVRSRTPPAFIIAVFITFVLSLFPTRWLGWVGDVSSIVRLPVAPLGDLGNSAAHWMRPPAERHAELDPTARELVTTLEEQRDRYERLYHAAVSHATELEQQLQELQQVPVESLNIPVTLLRAQITTRHPNQPNGPVQLNRGSRHGVERGAIAVYQGVHMVGRVADISNVSCSLHPMTHSATGLIRAAIFTTGGEREDATAADAARVALRATGDGEFIGDVSQDYPVQVGDTARLFDSAWPASAQAMIIGSVIDVRTKDRQPLRNEIVVQPRFTVSQLAVVTLIIEEQATIDSDSIAGVKEGARP